MFETAYFSVALIGLLHGIEPGHGWPVAVIYSLNRKNPVFSAIISSLIIGLAHLFSSLAVVVAFVLLQNWLDFDAPWIKYVAGAVLIIIGVRMFFEKPHESSVGKSATSHSHAEEHSHSHDEISGLSHDIVHEHEPETSHEHRHSHGHRRYTGNPASLPGIASFAFILGFAHEEEFALLAMVAGGVNAWILMITYGIAVIVGLMFLTILGVQIYSLIQPKLNRFEKYLPKAGAIFLVFMAVLIMLR